MPFRPDPTLQQKIRQGVPLTPTIAETPTVPESQRLSFLERAQKKIGSIFPGEKLGEAVGTSLAAIGKYITGKPEEARSILQTQVKPVQVAGDIANIALTAGTLGGLGTAGGLGARMLKTGAVGAGFGIASALAEGNEKKAVENALIGGVIGATLPVAGAGISRFGKWAFKALPERLYSQIFKQAKDDLRQAWQTEAMGKTLNPTLAKEILDEGLFGTSKNMAIYSFRKLAQLEQQVQTEVKDPTKIIGLTNKPAYVKFLITVKNQFKQGFFTKRAKESTVLINELNTAPTKQAQMGTVLKLRRFMDAMRSTPSFKLDPKLAPRQEEYKAGADLLRKKLSDEGLGDLMNKERIYIEALDNIINDAVKRQNKVLLNLTDIILGGGGMSSGFPGTGLGAMAGVRLFQQPPSLTGAGQAIYRAGKVGEKVAQPLGRIFKTGILKESTQ